MAGGDGLPTGASVVVGVVLIPLAVGIVLLGVAILVTVWVVEPILAMGWLTSVVVSTLSR